MAAENYHLAVCLMGLTGEQIQLKCEILCGTCSITPDIFCKDTS